MKRHIDRPPSRPRSCSGCRPGPGSRTAQLSTRATDVAIRAQGRRTLLFVEAARTGDVVDFVDATGAAWAWQLGASLLAKVLPRRWDHSTGSPAGRASVHRSLSHLGSSWLRMSNTSRSISSVGGTPTRAELTRYRPPGRRARATSAMTAARSATRCSSQIDTACSIAASATGRCAASATATTGPSRRRARWVRSKADANRYLAQVEADLLRGVWTDPRLARITFGEWVERWWPTTADLRPGTRTFYDYLLRRLLLPAFEETPLGRIDAMTVRSWLADLHEVGEVTPTTIAKAYRLLRRILNVAVEAGYLPRIRRRSRVPGWSGRPRCGMCRSRSCTPWPRRSRAGIGRWSSWPATAGCGGGSFTGFVVAASTWRVPASMWSSRWPRSPASSSSRHPRRRPGSGWWCCRRRRWRRWPSTWRSSPRRSWMGWCSRADGAPTCSGATSVGWCGARRSSGSAWRACASTTYGIPPRPWPLPSARPPRS